MPSRGARTTGGRPTIGAMKTILRFLVLRYLGWRTTALLALVGLVGATRDAVRKRAVRR